MQVSIWYGNAEIQKNVVKFPGRFVAANHRSARIKKQFRVRRINRSPGGRRFPAPMGRLRFLRVQLISHLDLEGLLPH